MQKSHFLVAIIYTSCWWMDERGCERNWIGRSPRRRVMGWKGAPDRGRHWNIYVCLHLSHSPPPTVVVQSPPPKWNMQLMNPMQAKKKTFRRLNKNSFYFIFFSVHESQRRGFICGLFGLRVKNNIPIAYLLVAASAPRQVVWLTLFSPLGHVKRFFFRVRIKIKRITVPTCRLSCLRAPTRLMSTNWEITRKCLSYISRVRARARAKTKNWKNSVNDKSFSLEFPSGNYAVTSINICISDELCMCDSTSTWSVVFLGRLRQGSCQAIWK